jgi:TonB family protein
MNLLLLTVPFVLASTPSETANTEAPVDAEQVDAITKGPQLLENPLNPYPEAAKAAGIEATVTLLIQLDETGKITAVEPTSPDQHGFNTAATEAVWGMSFSPAETASGPIPIAFELAYDFRLPKAELPPPPPPLELPINVSGFLREKGTRRPIERASVTVQGTDIQVLTGSDGSFSMRGVPLGDIVLNVVHIGHEVVEKTFTLVENEGVKLALWARADTYAANEAVARYRGIDDEIIRHTVEMEDAARIPGSFGDPVRIIQTLPGAAKAPFGSGLLIIRGSNPEDTGVYVDGVRIPIIYHLTGTSSVIAPGVIDEVEYLPGGYGVQYGRTMGGTVNIITKNDYAEDKISWGSDIIDSQVFFEGRVGKDRKGALAVGGRRSYIDKILPFILPDDFQVSPRYYDYQMKYIPTVGGDFSFFVYGFNDRILLSSPEDRAQGSDQDTQGDLQTEYASHRFVVSYKHDFSDKFSFSIQPSLGLDYAGFGVGDEITLSTSNTLIELRSELSYLPSDKLEFHAGLDLLGGPWDFLVELPFTIGTRDDPLNEREPFTLDGAGWGWSPDPYIKMTWKPIDGSNKLRVTPGLRGGFVFMGYDGSVAPDGESASWTQTSLDPRLAIQSEVTKRTSLRGAVGVYHQPPQPFESVGYTSDNVLLFEKSLSSSIGVSQRLGESAMVDVDIFQKDMSNLIANNDEYVGGDDNLYTNNGLGRAYGLEIIAKKEHVGNFFGWISYTLSKSERRDSVEEEWVPFAYDQTHIFSAQGGVDLPFDLGLSAQIQYVTGKPTTYFDASTYDIDADSFTGFQSGSTNAERMPDFFQTSVRIDKLFSFKNWQLDTYLDLLNVVRGTNPEFVQYNYDYTEYTYVSGLPFIPNLGLEAKFWL